MPTHAREPPAPVISFGAGDAHGDHGQDRARLGILIKRGDSLEGIGGLTDVVLEGQAAYCEEKNQRSIDGLAYLREVAEIAVLGFVGPLNPIVNTRAVTRYRGGNVVLSNLLVAVRPPSKPVGTSRIRQPSPPQPSALSAPVKPLRLRSCLQRPGTLGSAQTRPLASG